MTLTPEHAEYLAAHAVDLELAQQLGVRSVAKPSELPDEWRAGIGKHLPGIIFPWTSADGRTCVQLRPDTPPISPEGDKIKYVFQKDTAPVLWEVRANPSATRILLVEGSKQCLVAAKHAPTDFAVYGIAGCWGWSHDGTPIGDLQACEDREVVVIFDADAGTNYDVYTAAERLTAALEMYGATKTSWVRVPAGRTNGLDDTLAPVPAEKRSAALHRLIEKATTKIADSKPRAKKVAKKTIQASEDRPFVAVDDDPLAVIDNITKHLIKRWDGTELFCHGGVLSMLGDDTMHPLDKESFNDLVVKTITPVVEGRDGPTYQVPSVFALGAVHVSRASEFTLLDRLAKVPFVRPDGSVCVSPGYDAATQTLLVPSPDLEGVVVPEEPTREQVQAAVDLLLGDWLADMPFPDPPSRANTLALILTYFVRGLVNLVPLAVISGLQMGVGKNLLADCISIVVLGRALIPKPFLDDDDENRKALLAAFRAGEPAITWDEAHRLHGSNLARAITAETYADRILGVSREASFPNRMVWTALGNQVQIVGDIQRRVYPIMLAPAEADPQNRRSDTFRHPDLRGWTREHRAELVTACLTLVRAWFVAGQPAGPVDFGSFEQWQRMVGGILQHAGVEGFLANRREWASENDFTAQCWVQHMNWLDQTFSGVPFTTKEVKREAQRDLTEYAAPPGMEDVSGAGYSRNLGTVYGRRNGVWCDGLRLVKVGTAHGGANKWQVLPRGDGEPQPPTAGDKTPEPPESGDSGVSGDTPPPFSRAKHVPSTRTHARTRIGAESPPPLTPLSPGAGPLVVDLETADANDLWRYGAGFVRLGGYAGYAEETTLTTDFEDLARRVSAAERVDGHNLMGFDLLALARYHGLDLQALVRRGAVFDTLLAARHIDPPMAREKGRDFDRRYDLDTLGQKYEVGGKSHDLKALAKKHGGFDQIPVDDEEYQEYARVDVKVSGGLAQKLYAEVGQDPYLQREHRVAGIAAQISLNGFQVDNELLDERLNEGERRKGAALRRLNERYGIPLEDEKGKRYLSPLATKAGKAALVQALTERGATGFWTTEKAGDIATSAEAMKHLALQHMDNREVVEICKMVIVVVTTRTVYTTIRDSMIDDGDLGFRVHPTVVMKQSTGRWSLSKPGLTVLGKRGGRYREREVLRADPGHVIIAVDLSQVDMRAIAGLSGDRAYIDMLRHEDPHAEIARLLFGDPTMRDVAKPIGHGWNYGRGLKAISESNDIAPNLVRQFDESMRERFPRLVEWREEIREIAGSGELLDNGFGRKMRPDPTRAHTQGPALMGQGAARDLMMEGLLRLPDEALPYLRAQVHDEIVLSVPAKDAVDIQRAVIDALSFEWDTPSGEIVPIVAEGGPTDRTSWGDVYRKAA